MLRIVSVQGAPYEIGLQYGTQCSSLIRDFYCQALDQVANRMDTRADELENQLPRLLAKPVDAVANRFPHLIEEVKGLAAGASLSFEQAFFLQVRFEMLYMDGLDEECTTVGIAPQRSRTGNALVAQNIDLPLCNQRFMLLLHVQPKIGPRILMCTHAGVIGEPGLNSCGLAALGNLVVSDGWGKGCPARAFLRRAVLEQASVRDAIGVIRSCKPRASGHNLMLADKTGVVADVELTPDSEEILYVGESRALAHTNHYLSPPFLKRDRYENQPDSERRLNRINQLLAQAGEVGPEDLVRMLSDHEGGICRHADNPLAASTVASVVAEPSTGTMWVTEGNPCRGRTRIVFA